MPPKKRRNPVNPIVVGTVSTRSTRRQSIVNIEIPPRASRSNKNATRVQKESKITSSGQSTNVIFPEKTGNSNPTVKSILDDWEEKDDTEEDVDNSEIIIKSETGVDSEVVESEIVIHVVEGASNSMETSELPNTEYEISEQLENLEVNDLNIVGECIVEETSNNSCSEIILENQEPAIEIDSLDEEEITVECVTEEILSTENSSDLSEFVVSESSENIVEILSSGQDSADSFKNSVVEKTIINVDHADKLGDSELLKTKEIDLEIQKNKEIELVADKQIVENKHDISEESFASEVQDINVFKEIKIVEDNLDEKQLHIKQYTNIPQSENKRSIEEASDKESIFIETTDIEVSEEIFIDKEDEGTISESNDFEEQIIKPMVQDVIMKDLNIYKKFEEDDVDMKEVEQVTNEKIIDTDDINPIEVKTTEFSNLEKDEFKNSNESLLQILEEQKSPGKLIEAEKIPPEPDISSLNLGEIKNQSILMEVVEMIPLKIEETPIQSPVTVKEQHTPTKEMKSPNKKETATKKEAKPRKKSKEPKETVFKLKITPKKPGIPKIKLKETKAAKEPKTTKKSSTKSPKPKTDSKKIPVNIKKIEENSEEVRRSTRIKSIVNLKKPSKGHGLVRSKSDPLLGESDMSENSNSGNNDSDKPTDSPKPQTKEQKSSSRNSKSRKCNNVVMTDVSSIAENVRVISRSSSGDKVKLPTKDLEVEARLKQFVHLKENSYLTDRLTCKEAKKMTCDCFLTEDEIEKGELGCGEDCLNRLLMIECGTMCPVGDRCTNKKFQKTLFAPVEVFNTEKKGLGLRAAANIPYGEFILEYVGEVLDPEEFDKRADVYSQDKNIHYYFMSLRADAIIDATMKGNISRFINHSCDPNAETQKWTVNGELRIGFFSTRTILAGEEITFDYRFQRYGKEAQKCYCEASICRGWLGEEPEDEFEDDEEEEELADENITTEQETKIIPEISEPKEIIETSQNTQDEGIIKVEKSEIFPEVKDTLVNIPTEPKKVVPRRKPRKEKLEMDQLDEEIEMVVETGLKNQAHTLKLSRLMVRAKEPSQRQKLLKVLRRGELPCRRLFLDYHGLRLMHGYMIDAQHLAHTDKKYDSLRLEMLQTLATLPIQNKTMLQDSKVLPTVENWAANKDLGSPVDSESNSPNTEQDIPQTPTENNVKIEDTKEKMIEENKIDMAKSVSEISSEDQPNISVESKQDDPNAVNYEVEIIALALKLLEEWSNLKEMFRIPKKERIEQMKEHEREANKKFMAGYGTDDSEKKQDLRYRHLSRYKMERSDSRRHSRFEDNYSPKISKYERRKLFALHVEQKEEERRRKQREMWRQHEQNCMMIGTDPRFTAPFDPSRGYQCIWNPQIGQWQNYPLPPQNQTIFTPPPTSQLPALPNMSVPPPVIPKSHPSFPYSLPPLPQISTSMSLGITPHQVQTPTSVGIARPALAPPPTVHLQANLQQPIINMQGMQPPLPGTVPSLQINYQQQEPDKMEDATIHVKFMGPIPPPVKLPPKWKCAKDKYGRPYYYHIKIRRSQWEPPELLIEPEESSEETSSSESSSVSSESSSEDSDSEDEIDDTRLLLEVRKQMEKSAKLNFARLPPTVKNEEEESPSPEDKTSVDIEDVKPSVFIPKTEDETERRPSIDIRLKEQFNLLKDDKPPAKKRRLGLVQEIIISPRTEADRLQFKEDLKRYKQNKEKLKKQKEFILAQTRKQLREAPDHRKLKDKKLKASVKSRIKEMVDCTSENAKKIKESFRSCMATVVVASLNGYRKPDCKEGRITNTEDFKHLARKLTHFVMLKEMKHIAKIEELTCTDSVKAKAREYIRKYMSKFGEIYQKRNDEPDFKD